MLKYGFAPEKTQHTFDQYERAGSSVFYSIHDLLRLERHGYLKVRDHLSREIRHKRITKNNAKELYALYASQYVDIKPFFDWIGSTDSGYKLLLKERFKYSYKKISKKANKTIKIQDYFISSYFEGQNHCSTKGFVIYHKGI